MANNSRSKLLYLKRILEQETGESRGLLMTQPIKRLHAYETPAERKATHDDETGKAIVKILKPEPFFGWIAGLGGTVRIHDPKSLKEAYNEYLKSLIEE